MTPQSMLGPAGCAVCLTLLLFAPQIAPAQEQLTTPSTSRIFGAPTGHRQPRPTDIPYYEKSAAEQQEEKQAADLNRKLKICRGC